MSPTENVQTIDVKVWLLGFVWTVSAPLLPVAVLIWEWRQKWADPIDWDLVMHQVYIACGLAALAYWRKYKALLKVPPIIEEAWKLKQGVEVTKTVTTIGRASEKDPIIATKVEEKRIEPIAVVNADTESHQ